MIHFCLLEIAGLLCFSLKLGFACAYKRVSFQRFHWVQDCLPPWQSVLYKSTGRYRCFWGQITSMGVWSHYGFRKPWISEHSVLVSFTLELVSYAEIELQTPCFWVMMLILSFFLTIYSMNRGKTYCSKGLHLVTLSALSSLLVFDMTGKRLSLHL